MSDAPRIDGRRTAELQAELVRRAVALLSGNGQALVPAEVTRALLGATARIGEEVTRRLDQVPEKQLANLLNAARIGRDPARPATLRVAFVLADAAGQAGASPVPAVARRGTRLMAEAPGEPVIFETTDDVSLLGGGLLAVRGVDADSDAVILPPDAFDQGGPLPAPIPRVLKSGGALGDEKIQVNPASGLAPGMILRLGREPNAPQHRVVSIEGDLVTIDPPLAAAIEEGTPATSLNGFAPFQPGSRNRQVHRLYLGDDTLFDLPSALALTITGLPDLPAATHWEWWGTLNDDDKPAWQGFEVQPSASGLSLVKPKGKTVRKDVSSQTKFWIRATLPGVSGALLQGHSIRVAVATLAVCGKPQQQRCDADPDAPPMAVDYDAVATTTPVVPNTPFHPLGTEPRLFDSFYLGCAEAFSKRRAEVSLCFEFGGPKLGTLAGIAAGTNIELFGVGTDRQVYRVTLEADQGSLRALPPPAKVDALSPQGDIAAQLRDDQQTILLGAPATGAAYRAKLLVGSQLDPAGVTWTELTGLEPNQNVTRMAFVPDGQGAVVTLGLAGKRVFRWEHDKTAGVPEADEVEDLLVFGDGTRVLRILDKAKLSQWVPTGGWSDPVAVNPADALPTQDRVAWAPDDTEVVFIAGRAAKGETQEIRLARVDLKKGDAQVWLLANAGAGLPIALEPPPAGAPDLPPVLLLATNPPTRIVWKPGSPPTPQTTTDPLDIGVSDNRRRQFLSFGNWTVVQGVEFGVLARTAAAAGASARQLTLECPGLAYIADVTGSIPAKAELVLFGTSGQLDGFDLLHGTDARVLLLTQRPGANEVGSNAPLAFFFRIGEPGDVEVRRNTLKLTPDPEPGEKEVWIELRAGTTVLSYWKLTRTDPAKDWSLPSDFPKTPAALSFQRLQAEGQVPAADVRLARQQAAWIKHPGPLTDILRSTLVWLPGADGRPVPMEPAIFGTATAVAVPHELISRGKLNLLVASAELRKIGPNAPANPALSWEYWNGRAWWALNDQGLADNTANLLVNAGVFFRVPSDLTPTDVGGKQNYWVRARLVGGDYGQARVVVKKTTQPETSPGGSTETQEITRDVSVIRAPYVVRLRVGYCLPEVIMPGVVLTEDNLGTRDQTSANVAGQPVEIFVPTAQLLNPVAAAPSSALPDDGRCDDPCPPRTPDPSDGDCGGGCGEASAGAASAVAGTATPQPRRGLLIGLAKPPAGDRIALFADVVPGGTPGRLQAAVLRAGSFAPLAVDDGTRGLSEPGIIAFPLRQPIEQVGLMGVNAYWLRLSAEDPTWSPQLRTLALNAASARSVETRAITGLGASSGEPGQQFRLAQPPIEPDSVELFVREVLTEDEAKAIPAAGITDAIGDMPGPFVLWARVEDLTTCGPTDRAYELDADSGQLTFGDGRQGAVPPIGADIVVRSYRRVIGAAANGVAQGAELQLVSPIAGVESVKALEPAAGGADAEPPDQARARGPAKLRHGGRLQTLADLEDAALASAPDVAQVAAAAWRDGIRLIVVLDGGDPVPGPARLRALHAELAGAAGYGIARPNGLTVVGPRLLPILVRLQVELDSLDDIVLVADAADRVLRALFDQRTGGTEGRGWPFGRRPTPEDCLGALAEVAQRAVIDEVEILDARTEAPLAETIAADRLIRFTEVRIVPRLAQGAAA